VVPARHRYARQQRFAQQCGLAAGDAGREG